MKKLNRKGFTLIELLAVIVILAIVLVMVIPSVITTMNDARDRQLQNSTDSVAEWFTKQYEIQIMGASLGAGSLDGAYKTFIGETGGVLNTFPTANETSNNAKELTTDVLVAAGVTKATTDIDIGTASDHKSYVYLNGGKVCVVLSAKSGGNFYVNAGAGGTTQTYTNKKCSAGCPATECASS